MIKKASAPLYTNQSSTVSTRSGKAGLPIRPATVRSNRVCALGRLCGRKKEKRGVRLGQVSQGHVYD